MEERESGGTKALLGVSVASIRNVWSMEVVWRVGDRVFGEWPRIRTKYPRHAGLIRRIFPKLDRIP